MSYYRGAQGIFIIFDITEKKSFDSIEFWLDEIKRYAHQNAVIILIGNKKDSEDKREISFEDASSFAEQIGIKYFETSAINGNGLDHVIRVIANDIYNKLVSIPC